MNDKENLPLKKLKLIPKTGDDEIIKSTGYYGRVVVGGEGGGGGGGGGGWCGRGRGRTGGEREEKKREKREDQI